MEKPSTHHLHQVISVTFSVTEQNRHRRLSNVMYWEGQNLTFWYLCQNAKPEFKNEEITRKNVLMVRADLVLDPPGYTMCEMHFQPGLFSVHTEGYLKNFKKKNYRSRAWRRLNWQRGPDTKWGGKNESYRGHPCLLRSCCIIAGTLS